MTSYTALCESCIHWDKNKRTSQRGTKTKNKKNKINNRLTKNIRGHGETIFLIKSLDILTGHLALISSSNELKLSLGISGKIGINKSANKFGQHCWRFLLHFQYLALPIPVPSVGDPVPRDFL